MHFWWTHIVHWANVITLLLLMYSETYCGRRSTDRWKQCFENTFHKRHIYIYILYIYIIYIYVYIYIYACIYTYTYTFTYLRRGYFSDPADEHSWQKVSFFHHMPCSIILSISLLHCFHHETSFVLDLEFYHRNTQDLVKICPRLCQFYSTYEKSKYFVY